MRIQNADPDLGKQLLTFDSMRICTPPGDKTNPLNRNSCDNSHTNYMTQVALHLCTVPTYLPLGHAYQESDLRVYPANLVSSRCSGLMVVGINGGCSDAALFRRSRPLITYQLVGELGRTTATGFADGKTLAKATWKHLKGRDTGVDTIFV